MISKLLGYIGIRWIVRAEKIKKEGKMQIKIYWSDGGYSIVIGSCTVWNYKESFRRCSTLLEGNLHEIWSYFRHYDDRTTWTKGV